MIKVQPDCRPRQADELRQQPTLTSFAPVHTQEVRWGKVEAIGPGLWLRFRLYI
jgi:hypothetical protein